ncbi:MAG: sigma 54-interacting transcriptional regulator [Burkholderiaceae bacterium]|nr:sigma 54-interacting transcriptional regulator [Burkholderiaceae bacterium]
MRLKKNILTVQKNPYGEAMSNTAIEITQSAGARRPTHAERGASLAFSDLDPRALTERFHFDLKAGCIWLDTQRVLILQAEWFVELRRELVVTLGVRKARGLITRLGYAAGCRDGQLAIKLHGSRPLREIVDSGTLLHALQGTVAVVPLVYELDLDAHHCHMEFAWKNSIEDHAQLRTAKQTGEPTCWMEIGYASGFLTTCLGSSVVVRETECAALGHSGCRCVARFEDEWDDPSGDVEYLQAWSAAAPPDVVVAGQPETNVCDEGSGCAEAAGNGPTSVEPSVLGRSAAFNGVAQKIERVAGTEATVLLLGESGVGKSLFAREIHRRGKRADGPFIELNCASLPETLLESELFGVERGAYTGANASRAGRFERAAGGTLFLDEIGTLGFTAQGKLLRVLQSGEFERLGGGKTLRGNVRLVAATNEDLRRSVNEGRFRLDLFYRLNLFPIEVPPLRDRRDDLPLLIDHFLERYRERYGRRHRMSISPRAYRTLLSHSWPGNVRELENVLERAVILVNDGETLDLHHLFTDPTEFPAEEGLLIDDTGRLVGTRQSSRADADNAEDTVAGAASVQDWARRALDDCDALGLSGLERKLVMAALREAGGDVRMAARKLGLTRAQIDYRLKKWGETPA